MASVSDYTLPILLDYHSRRFVLFGQLRLSFLFVEPPELVVEFLDFRHQVWWKHIYGNIRVS